MIKLNQEKLIKIDNKIFEVIKESDKDIKRIDEKEKIENIVFGNEQHIGHIYGINELFQMLNLTKYLITIILYTKKGNSYITVIDKEKIEKAAKRLNITTTFLTN